MQIALDTSTSRPLLALLDDEKVVFEWTGPAGTHHGETLLEGLDLGLKKLGRELKEVDGISVGIGPGTFTGLRIGVISAKFLADALSVAIVPVSSLQAQALSARGKISSGRIWSLTDAKRQEVYALCVTPKDLDPAAEIDIDRELALRPESLAAQLQPGDILLGEGAENYQSAWPEAQMAAADWRYLQAGNLGLIGRAKRARGEALSAVEIQARYLKTEKF